MAVTAFVSYSSKDSVFAQRLTADLISAGVVVWIDQREIRPGRQWDDEVVRAIEQSEFFLVILTPASMESEHVKTKSHLRKRSESSRFLCCTLTVKTAYFHHNASTTSTSVSITTSVSRPC